MKRELYLNLGELNQAWREATKMNIDISSHMDAICKPAVLNVLNTTISGLQQLENEHNENRKNAERSSKDIVEYKYNLKYGTCTERYNAKMAAIKERNKTFKTSFWQDIKDLAWLLWTAIIFLASIIIPALACSFAFYILSNAESSLKFSTKFPFLFKLSSWIKALYVFIANWLNNNVSFIPEINIVENQYAGIFGGILGLVTVMLIKRLIRAPWRIYGLVHLRKAKKANDKCREFYIDSERKQKEYKENMTLIPSTIRDLPCLYQIRKYMEDGTCTRLQDAFEKVHEEYKPDKY